MRKPTTPIRSTPEKAAATPSGLTRGQVTELIDDALRIAFRDHARNMEQHLKNIHERLVVLENR